MSEVIEIRATQLPARDLDYLRAYARASGYTNTGVGAVRFAVTELAERLRREGHAPTSTRPRQTTESRPETRI